MKDNHFMKKAIMLAQKAMKDGEVPIAAVITKDGKEIANAHNLVEKKQNACLHAELIAIEKACRKIGNKYLNDCEIYVNLEPCHMCAGAIANAKIKRVYFGAYDPKGGGIDHGGKVLDHTTYRPEVYGGIMENESALLLKSFFATKR